MNYVLTLLGFTVKSSENMQPNKTRDQVSMECIIPGWEMV